MFTAARPVPPSAAADPRTAVQLFPEASGRRVREPVPNHLLGREPALFESRVYSMCRLAVLA